MTVGTYRGRVALQNKIVAFLNSKPVLECKVHPGGLPGAQRLGAKRSVMYSRLITGIGKGGRAVAIYPIIHHREYIPLVIQEYMQEVEARGGIVGTASSIGDAWDVAFCDEVEYPRKVKTRLHTYWINKKEDQDGRTASNSEE